MNSTVSGSGIDFFRKFVQRKTSTGKKYENLENDLYFCLDWLTWPETENKDSQIMSIFITDLFPHSFSQSRGQSAHSLLVCNTCSIRILLEVKRTVLRSGSWLVGWSVCKNFGAFFLWQDKALEFNLLIAY